MQILYWMKATYKLSGGMELKLSLGLISVFFVLAISPTRSSEYIIFLLILWA